MNDTHDNDRIAAIVGAALGALHGAARLPLRCRQGLLGRTGTNDGGRVQELIRVAEKGWGPAAHEP